MNKRLYLSMLLILYGVFITGCVAMSQKQSPEDFPGSINEWIQVGDYDIYVHEIGIEEEAVKGKKLAYIEVEYANNRSTEELSCRRNQWYLYDTQSYSYEAESDSFNDDFNGDLYEITNLHYLGGERYLSPNMHVRGWLIFVVPEEATLDRIQFITGFLGTKSVDIPVAGMK